MNGDVSSSSFSLGGGWTNTFDFGVVDITTEFNFSVSNSDGVEISAHGEGCVDFWPEDICYDNEVEVNIDGSSVELCIDAGIFSAISGIKPCISF